MILNYMKNVTLDTLEADIQNNVSRYNSKDKWIDSYFEEKGIGKYAFSSGIAVPDVNLIAGDSSTDFVNSKNLFEAFKVSLSPIQASDLRLWAYLAHDTYWEYMRKRWAIDVVSDDDDEDTGTNKMIARIGSRYFFKASKGKAFVRQGIARLYWGAYLTYDETNTKDPYEITEYFFSKQDIFAVSTEHALARNKALLIGALKALKNYGELKRKDVRKFFVKLNQAGGIVVFDSLTIEDAYRLAQRILSEELSENEKEGKQQNSEITTSLGKNAETTIPVEEKNYDDDSSAVEVEQFVQQDSRIIVENANNGVKMPIAIKQKKFQTKPDLIGLKTGDTFRIRKNTWKILEIK